MTAQRLRLERIEAALEQIDPVFLASPQYGCEPLGEALGCQVVLKVETQNPIRSFKGRGASLFVERDAGSDDLVCASAGNFGQALAYACRAHGRRLTVFASRHANPLKLERMRALGAEVVQAGDDFDAAKDAARSHAAAVGTRYVEDGRELAISEGAGTLALELVRGTPQLDMLLVPLGNGALLAGVGTVARALAPDLRVVAVSAAGAPAMVESLRRGYLVRTPGVDTIADGVAVREPVPEALSDLEGLVDDTLLVADDAIVKAMRGLHEHAGLVVEPAGAVGLAALLHVPELGRGRRVATIVCGGNLTAQQRAAWLS
ncbi:MAG: pyridoxal-phosphate dependent enzyme [Trueperaceae bacterium]|nr:MAG: pyridoxal-phosphate dependent enzyme [Trueperaceae bacterium]